MTLYIPLTLVERSSFDQHYRWNEHDSCYHSLLLAVLNMTAGFITAFCTNIDHNSILQLTFIAFVR